MPNMKNNFISSFAACTHFWWCREHQLK